MKMKSDISKTKYRYLMDNLELSENRPIIKYTIPVPKGKEKRTDEFFDRDYPEVIISNNEMVKSINKVANALVAYGISKGNIVTIIQTNTPETIYVDYALSKIGAIANFIYPNTTTEEMSYFINELKSRFLFILDDFAIRKNVEEAVEGTNIKIISSSVIESFPKDFKTATTARNTQKRVSLNNEISWADFIEIGKEIEADECKFFPNSICSFVHTSGTSNIPRAVKESNENINSCHCNYVISKIEYIAGKTCVQTIPQFVEYGKTTNHMLFCNNVCVVLIPEMEPKNFYDLINLYNPEYAFATPSHGRELIKRNTNMSNMINLLFGGDGFDDLEEDMNKYIKNNGGKYPAFQGYGSTEVSAGAIINSLGRYRVGSLGLLIGDFQSMIIKPGTFDEIKTDNTVGELCLKGNGMTLGYAGNSKSEMQYNT